MTDVSGSWIHKKTGGHYIVMGMVKLQTAKPVGDMAELVLYIAENGSMWVRPKDEFLDGRFEEIIRDIPSTGSTVVDKYLDEEMKKK
jgi:hypothetical protein